jgi:GNAT superfamily N-acetyltransferase
MNAPRIRITEVRAESDIAAVRELFVEYAAAIAIDLEYQGFSAELASLPGKYSPPTGELFLARVGDGAGGCVALRALDQSTRELKRLYVRPAARGLGLARRLVEAAISSARRQGCAELRLDTLATMVPAQALYRSFGFVEIPPYGTDHVQGTRFYGLSLTG